MIEDEAILEPEKLLKACDISGKHNVADFGCGPGIFSIPIAQMTEGTVYCFDVLESALDEWDRGLRDNPTISSYYLEDASFLKIDNISVGYNFDMSGNKYFSQLRFYVAANNIYTFTKYSGLDPELSYNGSGLEFGLDMYDVYPKTRTITFGVNAKF